MKSFMNKRRKSVNNGPPSNKSGADLNAPPMPAFARGEKDPLRGGKLGVIEMPDLRFSKLDLNVDLSNIRGSDSRPSSFLQPEENRKSKLGFLGFMNGKASLSSEELQIPRLGLDSSKASSMTSLVESSRSKPDNSSLHYSTFSSKTPEQDRKKLIASATEAMNLDVPVKAPTKQQQQQQQVQSHQKSSSPLASPLFPETAKSKKDVKKEEKERALREKERSKEAAKGVKEAAKREKELSRRVSKSDLKMRDASSKQSQSQAPVQCIPANAPPSSHRSGQREGVIPSSRPKPTSPTTSSAPSNTRAAPNSAALTGGRPPNAPPSHKPPPAPQNGAKRPTASNVAPAILPQQRSANNNNKATRDVQASNVRSFQFPTSAQHPPVARSQSAIPAADGVARPVVSRGKTIAPEKLSSSDNKMSKFGGKMTDSPPQQTRGTFEESGPIMSSPRGVGIKPTRESSSDGYGTSSTADATTSIESSTSFEGSSPDSPLSNNDDHDRFVDASQGIMPRTRPRRDEEREEKTQSRMSMALDLDSNGESDADEAHDQKDPQDRQRRFSQLLMGSRPGGAADRAADRAATTSKQEAEEKEARATKARFEAQRQHYLDNGKVYSARPAPPPPQPIRRAREAVPVPKRKLVVRPEMIVEGVGWRCLGVGDVDVPKMHERFVVETTLVPRLVQAEEEKEEEKAEEESSSSEDSHKVKETKPKEPSIEYQEEQIKVRYSDLFEVLWTSTTPDVLKRLISHLDMDDLKALRQTSHSIRFTLNVSDNREMILDRFLSSVGYRPWTYAKSSGPVYRNGVRVAGNNATRDPCPVSFNDCEAFLISQDLLPEYGAVGKDFARDPDQMDPRMARLAQASTRAYSRVLTRLRLQPVFKLADPASTSAVSLIKTVRSNNSSSDGSVNKSASTMEVVPSMVKHNSYYPLAKATSEMIITPSPLASIPSHNLMVDTRLPQEANTPSFVALSPTLQVGSSPTTLSSSVMPGETQPRLISPWKPGRAAYYRVWVPASDPNGWLTDAELSQCEAQLFKAGVWNFLKRGDVVWNTAVGDRLNEGKYIFDGHYLRDLSYAHDDAGHLPSWLNCVIYSPSYWHNIIKSSSPRPIIYFDISPWKDQILSSLRLVQDHVESYSATGQRYRIAKWLYRSAANVTTGQIISKMSRGLEVVDEGWSGRIVIETEGTAEHAKSLISRCAGPNATPQAKAALLATVMGDVTAANKMMNTADTGGLTRPIQALPATPSSSTEVQNSPWMIMRERSRPGLIWIKLAGDRG
ncbi:hypothetical protein CBS101457_003344 [Exobasidium rhododendri]|nr:hypothetical protein CBS101457_003344 [Exobasidium rhododendri]